MQGLKVTLARSDAAMGKADAKVLSSLVGCLTKNVRCSSFPLRRVRLTLLPCQGKKAVAQKILLDAMEIMRREMAQSQAVAAAEQAARSQKAAAAQTSKRARQKDSVSPKPE